MKKFYAPAGFDRRNVFNFQYVYNLPQFRGSNKLIQLTAGGWEYSGVTQLWGGSPCLNGASPTSSSCDLNSSGNLGNGGFGIIRPDYIGGPIRITPSHNQPAGQNPMWYNPAAFASPAPGSFGDFHRNTIYGPGILNFNMALYKNFNFTENTRIQLRFEGSTSSTTHSGQTSTTACRRLPSALPSPVTTPAVQARSPAHAIRASCNSEANSTSNSLLKAGLMRHGSGHFWPDLN